MNQKNKRIKKKPIQCDACGRFVGPGGREIKFEPARP